MGEIGNTKRDKKRILNFKTETSFLVTRKRKFLNVTLGIYILILIMSSGLTVYASDSMSHNVDTRKFLKLESRCHWLDRDDLVAPEGLAGLHEVLGNENTTQKTFIEFKIVTPKIYQMDEGTLIKTGVAASVKGEGTPVFIAFLDIGRDVGNGLRAYPGVVSNNYGFKGSSPVARCEFVRLLLGKTWLLYVPIAVDTGKLDAWDKFEEIVRKNNGEIAKEESRVLLTDGEDWEVNGWELTKLFTSPPFTQALRPHGPPQVMVPFSEPEDEVTKMARNYYTKGFQALKEKEFSKAKEHFEQVIHLKINQYTSRGYLGRGTALNELGQFEQAVKDFNYVIQLDPENQEAFLLRGLAHDESDHFEEAFKDYYSAGRLYPEDGKYDGKPQFYTWLLSARSGRHFTEGRLNCMSAAKLNPEYKWCLDKMDKLTPASFESDQQLGAAFLQMDYIFDGIINILGDVKGRAVVDGMLNPDYPDGYYVPSDPADEWRQIHQEGVDFHAGMMGW